MPSVSAAKYSVCYYLYGHLTIDDGQKHPLSSTVKYHKINSQSRITKSCTSTEAMEWVTDSLGRYF